MLSAGDRRHRGSSRSRSRRRDDSDEEKRHHRKKSKSRDHSRRRKGSRDRSRSSERDSDEEAHRERKKWEKEEKKRRQQTQYDYGPPGDTHRGPPSAYGGYDSRYGPPPQQQGPPQGGYYAPQGAYGDAQPDYGNLPPQAQYGDRAPYSPVGASPAGYGPPQHTGTGQSGHFPVPNPGQQQFYPPPPPPQGVAYGGAPQPYQGYQSPPPPQSPYGAPPPQGQYGAPPSQHQQPYNPPHPGAQAPSYGNVPPPPGHDYSRPEYSTEGAGHTGYQPQHHSAFQDTTTPLKPEEKPYFTPGEPQKPKKSVLDTFTSGLNSALHDYARNLFPSTSTYTPNVGGGYGTQADHGQRTGNRFDSFSPTRNGNGIKWFVDGKDYMFALSVALERARSYIWIMDWWLSPEVYLRRPPTVNEQYRLDRMLQAAAARGVKINVIVYKEVTQALTLDSAHTKHALEALHPNIQVFRHPDHLPDRDNVLRDTFQKFKSGDYRLGDGLKGIYGLKNDVTFYFAHHEKLCLIDGEIAFMGGLDLCFGRYDTNDHPIADAHPSDINQIIFPGQDYNNARYMDFHDVIKPDQNKVSRLEKSRMGWTDVEICLVGPTVTDLAFHFVERWNYIYYDKYDARKKTRYQPLDESRFEGGHGYHRRHLKDKFKEHVGAYIDPDAPFPGQEEYGNLSEEPDGVRLQICRSAGTWSHGTPYTEHSIANAYIEIISAARHYVYMENQFFITATDPAQKPILNMIGRAIVDRIIRAHSERQKFRIIVVIPAAPGFAGDLQDSGALGTRAIIEFQYRSIHNDRGYSIMEQIRKAGIDPAEYIRFYNLRNYDRINTAAVPPGAASQFEAASRIHDNKVGGGYGAPGTGSGSEYSQYQSHTAPNVPSNTSQWDSISKCYMLGGPDIRTIPWHGDPATEIDAFVSEELYVHSKLLIADDKIVICGSANLNDRSQLGDRDSEIACIIEDPTPLASYMDGTPYTASHFAATLRRQIFRKHLGLIPAQDFHSVDQNMLPYPEPNIYDFDSAEDRLVMDPLSDTFWNFWNQTARVNTDAFEKVFHSVPTDKVRNWKQYDEYWSKHFAVPKGKRMVDGKEVGQKAPVEWGHVVKSEFSPGAAGAKEVREVLYRVRGNLVEMPLGFLIEEDIAIEGVALNAITETLYT